MHEAELGISWESLPNFCVLGPFGDDRASHACLARVTSVTRRGEMLNHLVDVKGEGSPYLNKVLAIPKGARGFHTVSRTSYLGVVDTPICPAYEILSESSCFLITETAEGAYLQWKVIGDSSASVKDLVKKLRIRGVDAKIVRMEKINGGRRLTMRQEQILKQAFMRGFFDSPKQTSAKELAEVLGCSPSTFVRLLKKAESKVLTEKFSSPVPT